MFVLQQAVMEAKQPSLLSYFKPSTSAKAGNKSQASISSQADIEEGVDINDLPALMDPADHEILIDDPLPLSPAPQFPVPPTIPTSEDSF